jgi:hypothetical protein
MDLKALKRFCDTAGLRSVSRDRYLVPISGYALGTTTGAGAVYGQLAGVHYSAGSSPRS